MTTIVFGEDTVAWDSRDTFGSRPTVAVVEKVVVIKNTVYGVAGDGDCCEAAPIWHSKGAKPKEIPQGDWEMVCITLDKEGKPVAKGYTNESALGASIALPFALGSGGRYALAGLMAGLDEGNAVALAANLDVFTGPPFKAMKYADMITPMKTRRKKSAGASRKKSGAKAARKKATRRGKK